MKATGYNSRLSWISMVAVAVIASLISIPMRLAGLFFVIFLDSYNVSRDEALIPIVTCSTISSLSGPIVGYLGQTCGLQATILTGCFLASLGIGLSFFTENLISLTICFGVIFGTGFALSFNLVFPVIRQHFTKHFSLTEGIMITTISLGSTLMTPFVHYLRNCYGASGMFLILSGIFLHMIPAILFLKDPKNEERKTQINLLKVHFTNHNEGNKKEGGVSLNSVLTEEKIDEIIVQGVPNKKFESVNSEDENMLSYKGKKDYVNEDFVIKSERTGLNKSYIQSEIATSEKEILIANPSEIELIKNFKTDAGIIRNLPILVNDLTSEESVKKHNEPLKTVLKKKKSKALCQSIRLMYNPLFLLLMIIQNGHGFGVTMILSVLLDYSRDKQISTEDALYFLTFMPITQIFGSLGLHWITDRAYMTRTNFCTICFFILALNIGFLIWSCSFTLLMIEYLMYSFVNGALFSIYPGMIIDNIEREQQNMALASRFALFGLLCPFISPLVGYFRGYLGSYDGVYYIMMGVSVLCAVLAQILPVLKSCKQKRKQKKEDT